MNAGQKMLIASATEHAELGRDYLRADMPGFALKHLRQAVERLEQAEAAGGERTAQRAIPTNAATNKQPGLIEI
jgi:hypothetical protein